MRLLYIFANIRLILILSDHNGLNIYFSTQLWYNIPKLYQNFYMLVSEVYMAVVLYKHNKETYENIISAFEDNNKVGVVQPTGTGKSFLILKWLEDNTDDRFIVLSPSVEIFNQLERYAAEMNVSINDKVSFITYEKLNFMEESEVLSLMADKIVLDEFHRAGAEQWGKSIDMLFSNNANAQVLGLTATPVRYLDDARNMANELFDGNIAREMTLGEAVAEGILPIPEYVPVWYDYNDMLTEYQDNIASIEDDKKRKELEETLHSLKNQLENSYGAKDIFKAHMPTNHGKWIVFCRNTEHIDEIIPVMSDWLSEVNINIHSYVSIAKRSDKDAQLTSFMEDNDNSAVKLLYTVDRFNEGVHIDGVDGVIMLRPTVSPIIYLQQMGRALSSKGTRRPVVFDMVNNYQNVMVDYGNGEENIFEKELYEFQREYHETEKDNEIFHIFEMQITFQHLLNNIEAVLYYTSDQRFNAWLFLLKEFMEIHKREPSYYETYKDAKIGIWCYSQRGAFRKGILSVAREMKLKEIGFSLDSPIEKTFNNNVALLKEFMAQHGREPKKQEIYKNVNLGKWCIFIRKYCKEGKLSEDKENALKEIGFSFEPVDEIKFKKNITILNEFIIQYGREPHSKEVYKSVDIGNWCAVQRRMFNDGNLSKSKELQLREIGVSFAPLSEIKFSQKLNLLKEFMIQYGREPHSKEIYKNTKIGIWCKRQRKLYEEGTLTKDKELQLREIGFCLSLKEKKQRNFEKNIEILKEFIEKYGRLPRQNEIYKNTNLGTWYFNRKRESLNGKMSKDKEKMFIEIGVVFSE